MPTLAAHQTQYLPYPGVFHKLFSCDVFVFQDDVQFVKQEFQNRNRIRSADGWRWLTLPVKYSSNSTIAQVLPADPGWAKKHEQIVRTMYAKSQHLKRLQPLWEIAAAHAAAPLSAIGLETTKYLAELLHPERFKKMTFVLESDLHLTPEETSTPTKRLIALCKKLGCDTYLSGAGGTAYLDTDAWTKENLKLLWQEYHAHEYPQLHEGWEPHLSTIDLLLSVDDPFSYLDIT